MEQKSIGGLWISESKNGNKLMKGSIEIDGKKEYIIIFKNNYKKDRQPDYMIYKQQQKEQPTDITEEIMNDEELPF